MFNSQPLLTQQVINKPAAQASAIAAGPRPKPPAKPDKSDPHAPVFKSGDPFLDPWSKQRPAIPPITTHPAVTASHSKPGNATSSRPAEGPIADMFQQQDQRILAIENAVTQLQTTQQQRDKETDTKITQIGQTLTQHMTLTSSNFEQLYGEQKAMSQSISTALQHQDDRLAQSMDELKAIFLQARGTKRTSVDAAEDMQDQE